ncbi:MAG: DUF1722 domain-containing protein [Atribacterota bacterium]|nr:DUF1722 domain-containing protein [Atribacterota bacterium]
MRVWDIHPGYLSDKSLLGEHVEIHALYSIICGGKKGYSQHPETKRWVENLPQLILRHNLVVKEMTLRSFRHNSPLLIPENIQKSDYAFPANLSYVDIPSRQFAILQNKYLGKKQSGRIPLPGKGTDFWAHHKYSVMARGYQYYKEVQSFMKGRANKPIQKDNELILKIHSFLQLAVTEKHLSNTSEHLWGYFKEKANQEEKNNFLQLLDNRERLVFLFALAQKYQITYLLHSTVFTDF